MYPVHGTSHNAPGRGVRTLTGATYGREGAADGRRPTASMAMETRRGEPPTGLRLSNGLRAPDAVHLWTLPLQPQLVSPQAVLLLPG